MFSLRTLIVLGAAVYMLPSEPARQQELLATLSGAYEHASTFCSRQPDVCQKAEVVLHNLKEKAQFGAGVVYSLAVGQLSPQQRATTTPAAASPDNANPTSGTSPANNAAPASKGSRWDGTPRRGNDLQGTLTGADLQPSWMNGKRAELSVPIR